MTVFEPSSIKKTINDMRFLPFILDFFSVKSYL